MRTSFGEPIENDVRHVPLEDLPSVEAVIGMVDEAHRIDLLPELGNVRFSGTLTIEKGNIEGSLTTLFDATRGRTEVEIGSAKQLSDPTPHVFLGFLVYAPCERAHRPNHFE